MKSLLVRAAPGIRCPREALRGAFITDASAVSVPSTPYYRRRLRSGELVLVDSSAPAATPEAT